MDYAQNYASENIENYFNRVKSIYSPKAKFLIDTLNEQNEDVSSLKFIDLGAGSGYFVSALKQIGLDKIIGYEVSKTQVELANTMNNGDLVKLCNLDEIETITKTTDNNVLCMIGVLEHLQQHRKILKAIKDNPNIKYLYISLPMFSPTVFFELVFTGVMNRLLTGGHTHLYTESSIDWFCKEYKFLKISEWWFGLDIMDLYRSISVSLSKNDNTNKMADEWKKIFSPVIDSLQLELDKKHLSSEIHLILKTQ